jgi:hypothetical protein
MSKAEEVSVSVATAPGDRHGITYQVPRATACGWAARHGAA